MQTQQLVSLPVDSKFQDCLLLKADLCWLVTQEEKITAFNFEIMPQKSEREDNRFLDCSLHSDLNIVPMLTGGCLLVRMPCRMSSL